jgi:hypothetical protein
MTDSSSEPSASTHCVDRLVAAGGKVETFAAMVHYRDHRGAAYMRAG